jgi:hypothetical protein
MSLKLAAQHLANKGRGPDTLLVHMAPGEVAGLQSLAKAAGGSLTVNPDTGLPEAGILSDLLPTILGFGASALTGGAISPWMIGAGVGGLKALQSGSLEQGVMAGLGAYGGAGLGQGLMGLGTGALSQQAAPAVTGFEGYEAPPVQLAQATPTETLSAGAKYAIDNPSEALKGMGGLKSVGQYGLAALAPALQSATSTKMPETTRSPGYIRPFDYDPRTMRYTPRTPVRADEWGSQNLAEGGDVRTVTQMPGQTASERAMDYLMGRTTSLKPTWEIAAPPVEEEKKEEEKKAILPPAAVATVYDSPGGAEFGGRGTSSTPDWGTTLSLGQKLSEWGLPTIGDYLQSEGRMGINAQTGAYSQEAQNQRAAESAAMAAQAAAGGGVDPGTGLQGQGTLGQTGLYGDAAAGMNLSTDSGSGNTSGGGYSPGAAGSESRDSSTAEREANGGVVGRYASGGLGSLGSYSDGGRLLRGPGDGVSDSIPATIGRAKQPARLADGEFVVPARIVSELGNGSTEAGARKLYAMMDRIQKARRKTVGKGRVAANTRAEKLLPA